MKNTLASIVAKSHALVEHISTVLTIPNNKNQKLVFSHNTSYMHTHVSILLNVTQWCCFICSNPDTVFTVNFL